MSLQNKLPEALLAPVISMTTRRTVDIKHPHNQEGVFESPEIHQTTLVHDEVYAGGSKINITLEKPIDVVDSNVTVLVNGYGGAKSGYRGLRHALASSGRRTVTIEPPRSQKLTHSIDPRHLKHPELLPSMGLHSVIKKLLSSHDSDQIDLVGHSMGGYIATQAAYHDSDNIASLTLMASAGLDNHSLLKMGLRGPLFFRQEVIPNIQKLQRLIDFALLKAEVRYILQNPERTIAEGISVASCNIRSQVKHLGEIGVKTAALQFKADNLFPLDSVKKHAEECVDIFMVHPDVNAGHLTPQLDPAGVSESLNKIQRLFRA